MEPVHANEGKIVSAENGLVIQEMLIQTSRQPQNIHREQRYKTVKKKKETEKCPRKPPNQTGK